MTSQQKFHEELLNQMKEVHQKSELLTSKMEAVNSQNEEVKDDKKGDEAEKKDLENIEEI